MSTITGFSQITHLPVQFGFADCAMVTRYYHVNLDRTQNEFRLWTPDMTDVREEDVFDLSSAIPLQGTHVWSPEHLFTASVAATILSGLLTAISRERMEIDTILMRATAKAELNKDGPRITDIIIVVDLEAESDEAASTIEQILSRVAQNSMICKTSKIRIHVRPVIDVNPFAH